MFSVAIPLIALATVAGPGQAAPKGGTAAQCEIALQVMKDITAHEYGKPMVFDTHRTDLLVQVDAEALAKGWTKFVDGKTVEVASPPTQVAAEFLNGGFRKNSVSSCFSVRKWLTEHQIRYGRAAVRSVSARAIDDELPAGIFTVSLPVVSNDGQVALVYTSDVWGGEAGGGAVELYRRQDDGTWKFVADRRLWIS